jgi:diacylglycerol kinase (ATP)
MKKNLILFNPSSGQNRAINHKEQLEAALVRYNVNYELIVTQSEDHLRRLVQQNLTKAKVSSIQSISTAGGDSTFTILVNEMLKTKTNVPVGIIPLGSSDDIARELNIRSIDDAVSAISAGRCQKMDVGKITDEKGFTYYFSGQANVGIGVFVNRFVAEFQKHSGSHGGEPLCFFKLFFKNQTLAGIFAIYHAFQENVVPAKFTVRFTNSNEGKRVFMDDDFVSLLFSKIRFWSTGRLFLPDAKINDGNIHLLMIKKCGFLKTLQIMLKAASGRHIDEKIVQYIAASSFQLTSEKIFMIQVDGDIIRESGEEKFFNNVTIEVLKDRIDILTP